MHLNKPKFGKCFVDDIFNRTHKDQPDELFAKQNTNHPVPTHFVIKVGFCNNCLIL